MIDVRCPKCKRLLFKASVADVEVMCGKCKRLVSIKMTTQSASILDKLETQSQPTKTLYKINLKE